MSTLSLWFHAMLLNQPFFVPRHSPKLDGQMCMFWWAIPCWDRVQSFVSSSCPQCVDSYTNHFWLRPWYPTIFLSFYLPISCYPPKGLLFSMGFHPVFIDISPWNWWYHQNGFSQGHLWFFSWTSPCSDWIPPWTSLLDPRINPSSPSWKTST
jgi:hypothetical protein